MMVSAQSADTNGFPSELDDRGWLAAHYRSLGDETVAAELRVSRKSVQRARERLGIAGNSHANGNGHTNGSGSGNGASSGAHARPMLALAPSADTTGRPFVSDEELTRRITRVKKSLADTCARLVAAINELEWVRQQVAPPDQQQSRRAA